MTLHLHLSAHSERLKVRRGNVVQHHLHSKRIADDDISAEASVAFVVVFETLDDGAFAVYETAPLLAKRENLRIRQAVATLICDSTRSGRPTIL